MWARPMPTAPKQAMLSLPMSEAARSMMRSPNELAMAKPPRNSQSTATNLQQEARESSCEGVFLPRKGFLWEVMYGKS